MLNEEIIKILKDNNLLKEDYSPKKSLNHFLLKPENLKLKEAIYNNTSFVKDLSKKSIRERIYCIVNNIKDIPKCVHCSNDVKFRHDGKYAGSYADFCSRQCISRSNKIKNKKKETIKRKYGVENPFQAKEIKKKIKKTLLEKYGVEHPLQSFEIKEKYKKTCLKRFSASNPMKSINIQSKVKKTNKKLKNVEYSFEYYLNGEIKNIASSHISEKTFELLNNKDYLISQHYDNKKTLTEIAEELGTTRMTVLKYLSKFNLDNRYYMSSSGEKEICSFINSLFDNKITILTNTKKVIPPYELDIYIPDYNLAIEYNGLYWHSEAAGKNIDYHLTKTKLCEEKGIRLIHIFEDEWRDQQQKCKETLIHLLGKSPKGTYARNTIIREISWKEAKEFLNRYHLLGAGTPGNYRIGAFDKNDNLIGVMVFGHKNNEGKDKSIELKRFVTNKKNNPGLGSKMFKYAVEQKKYDEVIAFVDRRWFTGSVKDNIGFIRVSETLPSVWWTDGKNRYHRRFITKNKLIKDGFSKELSKKNILESLGFSRIWDSGKIKLRWSSN